MDNLIRVYDKQVSEERCQQLIEKFESDTNNHKIQDCGNGATLTQINLLNSPDTIWKEDANFLVNVIMNCVYSYKKDCEIKENQWPEKFGFEPPKIKRYTPSTGEWFPEHVDVLDHRTARRFLVAFLYLDHNKRGSTVLNPKGETFVSSCKTGSVLLFPPMWPWLHTGCFPVDKPKYIVGSYLHYP